MIRKWLTTLLAVALALLMPLYALADTQHTLTIIPGDDLAQIPAAKDLLDVLSFTVTTGDESGAFSIGLEGENLLTIAGTADTTGMYVQSNILSDDVLYVSWEDGIAVLTQLAASEMSSDEAEMLRQSLEQMVDSMKMGAKATSITTIEDSIAMAKELYAEDPAMVQYIVGILDRVKTENGTFAVEGRDTATTKQTLTFTSDDLLTVCDTNMMRTMMEEIIRTEQPALEGDELAKETDKMLDMVRDVYRAMELDGTVTVYTNGETLVGLDMDMPMSIPETDTDRDGNLVIESEKDRLNMTMNYGLKSDANGEQHTARITMAEVGDDDMVDVQFDLYKGADGVSKGSLAMLADEEEITFLYNAYSQGEARIRQVDLYARSDANAIVAPSASSRPLIGFQVVSQKADPAVLADVEAADPTSAVDVMKLSAEEMNTLVSDIEARAMQMVFSAMSKLPTSVLNMLMEN